MTISIDDRKVTDEYLKKFGSNQDKHVEQIPSAWGESEIKHDFKNEGLFKKAVRRNLKALDLPDAMELFTPCNFLFSTQKKGWRETLYFGSYAKPQTGRLRQEHPDGPLAKVDKRARTHLFLSSARFECLRKWHECHPREAPPRIRDAERRTRNGKWHIEFAYADENRISGWHRSRGKVNKSRRNLKGRVDSALKAILGMANRKGA